MRKVLRPGAVVLAAAAIFLASAAVAQASTPISVALGDSVAAGAGLNPHPPNGCNQSVQAYPWLVASAKHDTLLDLACAGATVPAGITGPQGSYPAQLPLLFNVSDPAYVTITIGANDIQAWTSVQLCYLERCNSNSLPSSVRSAETGLRTNLGVAMFDIATHYAAHTPEVIVTGYYDPYSAKYNCADLGGENPAQLAVSGSAVMNSLNSTLQAAIQPYAFARFAPVSFAGHELCSPDPWVQGRSSPAPNHPTAQGQQAIAAAVLATLG